jgi:DNA-binding GntR family transcriptional regulator
VYRRLVNELNLFRRQTLAQRGSLPVFAREHRDIVVKIASRNAAAAGKALRDHVMGSRERMHRSRSAGVAGKRHVAVNAPRQSR